MNPLREKLSRFSGATESVLLNLVAAGLGRFLQQESSRNARRVPQEVLQPDHSVEEHRYLFMGQSTARRLLIVSYTERDQVIRLISAREMTASERRAYEEG